MNKYYFLLPILSIVFCFACGSKNKDKTFKEDKSSFRNNNQNTTIQSSEKMISNLLIFKKEQVLEYWVNGLLSFTVEISVDPSLAIGVFDIITTETDELSFQISNDFYQSKYGKKVDAKKINITTTNFFQLPKEKLLLLKNNKQPPKQIFIFPNDARSTNHFDPCLGCPHWMAEMYSSLQLYLKAFILDSR